MQVVVELVDEWHASRHIVLEDLLLRHAVKNLDDGSQRVAVSHNDDVLVVEHLRSNRVEPVWQDSIDGDFQTLSSWDGVVWQVLVLGGEPGMSRIVDIEWWWWDVIASAPLQHLFFAMLLGGLSLVETLQGTVVPLIQSPVLVVRNPVQVKLVSDGIISLNGALQHTSVGDIESKSLFLQHLTSLDGLLDASFGKRNIVPTGEPVFLIPG